MISIQATLTVSLRQAYKIWLNANNEPEHRLKRCKVPSWFGFELKKVALHQRFKGRYYKFLITDEIIMSVKRPTYNP